jgi:hypothetical protein
VVTAAAGALRTGSAYARFLDWGRAPDVVVAADPYVPGFARLSPAAIMRVPQAADAAVIKTVSFALAQRTHLRAGDPLPLVMDTVDGRNVPFVFHVAGIDAAASEFPPQLGKRHLYRLGHPALLPPAPSAERIHPGSAAVRPRQPGLVGGE